MLSNPIPQAICLQVLSFRPHAFKILSKTHLPRRQILDLFQQSKPPVCWVPCWLGAKKLIWQYQSQFFSCYCITATGMIEYQGTILIASNEPYFHLSNSGSKGLRLCVKLLTWLELIYIMIKLSVCNCKAIKKDLNLQRNQIKEGRFPTNEKMVGWQRESFSTNRIAAGGLLNKWDSGVMSWPRDPITWSH